MKVLVFDIFGDFAHFRKFFTTSSPLTFPFPPPPTVRGIIGAILGFGREEYLEKTKDLYIGIGILSPIKKIRMGRNLVFTKDKSENFDPTLISSRKAEGEPRTQVRAEFVKDPKYRIYVSGEEEFLNNLKEMVENHRTYYTVSLGLSELLADFSYVGIYQGYYQEESEKADSVIPVHVVDEINIERLQKIGKERIPTLMDVDRTVRKYEDVIFNMEGGAIYGKFKNLLKLENGEVIHLWRSQEFTPTQMYS
ncbi:type I-B CRISPR-associated protein Cas5b [Hydrogenobacter hydrogenophilus]|uniref:type I-B CRISPR-associated protein Cas5b n=1 Tax=Hydrogenobacter hydrogenophilus TaxID=35835 RepID=UPI000BBC58B7|nr:type I-B CRISPR-associated protein Cas5b [Hydrogenobacter hydrogenophilus]